MLTLAHSRHFSVAAGILPAVEPGRPARRRKRSHTPTVLENFRTTPIFHRSFRAAGRQPSTAGRMPAATTNHGTFGLFIAAQPDYFHHEMDDKIPYLDLTAQLRPLRKELDAVIARTIDNCSFCLGPDVAQFEKDFAKFIGAEHCVGFNSGTSALHVAMLLLGVGTGDEVITTPFTFVATSWAISYTGAKPVFVDIDDATFNLDPKLIERA